MLLMVDNSQGHSAYAEDALLVSCINMNPGDKQAILCNGWFFQNGIKTTQAMYFLQTIHNSQANRKDSNKFLSNGGYLGKASPCYVETKKIMMGHIRANVMQQVPIVAYDTFLSFSQTFLNKNHLFKKLLKQQDTYVLFSRNSTVNSILLSSSGGQ